MEQPNSFLKVSCHLFSPIGIYRALETEDSDLSMSIPLLEPFGRLRWACLEWAIYKEPLGTCPPNLVIHHHPNPVDIGSVWNRGLPPKAADSTANFSFEFWALAVQVLWLCQSLEIVFSQGIAQEIFNDFLPHLQSITYLEALCWLPMRSWHAPWLGNVSKCMH